MGVEHQPMVEAALADLVRRYGRDRLVDSSRVRGLLTDVLAANSTAAKREIRLVAAAAGEDVPAKLERGAPTDKVASSFSEATGFDPAAAHWAVSTWARVLAPIPDNPTPVASGAPDGTAGDTSRPSATTPRRHEPVPEMRLPVFDREPLASQGSDDDHPTDEELASLRELEDSVEATTRSWSSLTGFNSLVLLVSAVVAGIGFAGLISHDVDRLCYPRPIGVPPFVWISEVPGTTLIQLQGLVRGAEQCGTLAMKFAGGGTAGLGVGLLAWRKEWF